jgi:hypothetical protein
LNSELVLGKEVLVDVVGPVPTGVHQRSDGPLVPVARAFQRLVLPDDLVELKMKENTQWAYLDFHTVKKFFKTH